MGFEHRTLLLTKLSEAPHGPTFVLLWWYTYLDAILSQGLLVKS